MRVVDESPSLSSARRECGRVAGDQSAARFARAQVTIGHLFGHCILQRRAAAGVYSAYTPSREARSAEPQGGSRGRSPRENLEE